MWSQSNSIEPVYCAGDDDQMAAMKPAAGKPGMEEEVASVHRIRITLTSRNVRNLESGN
jgi:hypothetical protein